MTIEKRVAEDFRKLIQGKNRAHLCYIMSELNIDNYQDDVFEMVQDSDDDMEVNTISYIARYVCDKMHGELGIPVNIEDDFTKEYEKQYIDIINDMQLTVADGELNLN